MRHPLYVCAAGLLLALAPLTAQKRDPLPVPSPPGYHTLKCDFHMHTVFSDGEVWPLTRVKEAWRDGLDAISITDHDNYRPHGDDVTKDLSRSYALALPLAQRLGVILIPGTEITRGDIHFNALFVTEPNLLPGPDLMTALREARKQGAFVFWNHPGWKKKADWFPEIAAAHKEALMSGVELVNGNTFYAEAFPWIGERKLAILCNSDAHEPVPPAADGQYRPVTLVFAATRDAEGIRNALKAGQSAAWMGGEVWGPEPYLRGIWQAAVKAGGVTLQGRARDTVLTLENTSAIPFRVKSRGAPPGLAMRATTLAAQRTTAVRLGVTDPNLAGRVEMELEIANLHTGPGSNLVVRLPLSIERRK